MTVHQVTPAIDTSMLLAGAQFADAFRIERLRPESGSDLLTWRKESKGLTRRN